MPSETLDRGPEQTMRRPREEGGRDPPAGERREPFDPTRPEAERPRQEPAAEPAEKDETKAEAKADWGSRPRQHPLVTAAAVPGLVAVAAGGLVWGLDARQDG